MKLILCLIIAYLFGSISSAVIVSRLLGLPDPRTQGSGNPGATNVLRLAGRYPALLVFIGDMLKGLLPVLLARLFGLHGGMLAIVPLAALLGHIYPVFFQFKGGKGVATAFGALIGLSLPVGLCVGITWLLVAFFSRYSSLAALIAAVLMPIYMLLFADFSYFIPSVLMCVLLVWRHQENIQRLKA
ncbi:MAG: glycerol-3-phosphate 1-O-acyltransferase PlsY, partial [Gammaproteobacteria bacterium]